MSNPMRPVPNEQSLAFGRAVCARLGLDPAIVADEFSWKIVSGDELSPVTFTAYLPTEDLFEMFNAAGART